MRKVLIVLGLVALAFPAVADARINVQQYRLVYARTTNSTCFKAFDPSAGPAGCTTTVITNAVVVQNDQTLKTLRIKQVNSAGNTKEIVAQLGSAGSPYNDTLHDSLTMQGGSAYGVTADGRHYSLTFTPLDPIATIQPETVQHTGSGDSSCYVDNFGEVSRSVAVTGTIEGFARRGTRRKGWVAKWGHTMWGPGSGMGTNPDCLAPTPLW